MVIAKQSNSPLTLEVSLQSIIQLYMSYIELKIKNTVTMVIAKQSDNSRSPTSTSYNQIILVNTHMYIIINIKSKLLYITMVIAKQSNSQSRSRSIPTSTIYNQIILVNTHVIIILNTVTMVIAKQSNSLLITLEVLQL